MPEPIASGRRYIPGLDGLRAFAVLAVIAYHLHLGWAPGGLLGVAVFFTLSGYLITDLLLAQSGTGLRLKEFWMGRARRLLAPLFAMLLVVSVWVWADDLAQVSVVRGQALAALVYMSNWWQTFQHISYFARFGPPSPLNHLWSLSVEEQFYLLWPWLLVLGLRFVKERGVPGAFHPRLAACILLLALASAVEMGLLFHPGFDPSRDYYGTDTRAFGLLLGAAFACLWPTRALGATVGRHAARVIDAIGVIGLIGIAVMIWRTSEYSAFIYRGGFVLLSLFTLMTIAAMTHPASKLARGVGAPPLRWLGVRSYAIYLWCVPVIVLTTPNSTRAVQPLRALLQLGGILVIAAISWRYLENPIRHGALGRAWKRARDSRPARLGFASAGGLVAAATILAALALTGTIGAPALKPVISEASIDGGASPGVGPNDPGRTQSNSSNAGASGHAATGGPNSATTGGPRASHPGASNSSNSGGSNSSSSGGANSSSSGGSDSSNAGGPSARGATQNRQTNGKSRAGSATHGKRASLQTSCDSVVHIGDSTSDGLVSDDYLPDRAQQIPAQYARVGVKRSIMEITGGTSIVETLPGDVDARGVASNLIGGGYHGCWVIALGTNDTADVYVGSSISLSQRISEMMKVIGNLPVLWVNAKTLVATGPYSESNMQQWNAALVAACRRYPNMRVYNWAGAVQDRWFIPDGIHYYSDGYAARAHLIANALAEAFPDQGQPPSQCVVSTPTVSIPVKGIH
jgi:peptidoglycan/LPS O-acetylase OafA/YrhL